MVKRKSRPQTFQYEMATKVVAGKNLEVTGSNPVGITTFTDTYFMIWEREVFQLFYIRFVNVELLIL